MFYTSHHIHNVFSLFKLQLRGSRANFYCDSAELISQDGMCFPIMQQGRLYYLCKCCVHAVRAENLETWHKLLGYCNTNNVLNLEGIVKGMGINNKSDFQCETCILSKHTNSINKHPDCRATSSFELIHTDLAGPIEPVVKDGYRCAIIFTDDFSGCMFTYFLKTKSDSVQATKKFLADIVPYGKIKTLSFHQDIFPSGEVVKLHSDNSGEFISKEFKGLLLDHKISHELT